MIKAGIIGVTGYTGIELLRLLQQHPNVTVTHAFTESQVGQALTAAYPHLKSVVHLEGEALNIDLISKDCDIIFIALPHGHAAKIVEPLLAAGKKIIDLGADFRLRNPADYQQWYHAPAVPMHILSQAVYGLPEAGHRTAISTASLIANPGCYPTASILAALPILKAGLVDEEHCIFDAKSGVSGAGRTPSLQTHFCTVAENFAAYQLAGAHRHTPEIEQELSLLANKSLTIQFTPHLVPMLRGLLVTAYFKLTKKITQEDIAALYQQTYQHETFIRMCDAQQAPQTKQVRGSNYCDISVHIDTRTQRLIVISVIDNLIKGACGQAVQNMNLMFGLNETTGLLNQIAIYP